MIKKTTFLLLALIAFCNAAFSQNTAVEQTFHESGKINVVVAVVVIIFIGLNFYLIKLDRKIENILIKT